MTKYDVFVRLKRLKLELSRVRWHCGRITAIGDGMCRGMFGGTVLTAPLCPGHNSKFDFVAAAYTRQSRAGSFVTV